MPGIPNVIKVKAFCECLICHNWTLALVSYTIKWCYACDHKLCEAVIVSPIPLHFTGSDHEEQKKALRQDKGNTPV